jgi:hypothetical protein
MAIYLCVILPCLVLFYHYALLDECSLVVADHLDHFAGSCCSYIVTFGAMQMRSKRGNGFRLREWMSDNLVIELIIYIKMSVRSGRRKETLLIGGS